MTASFARIESLQDQAQYEAQKLLAMLNDYHARENELARERLASLREARERLDEVCKQLGEV